jgi:hypothetical protein
MKKIGLICLVVIMALGMLGTAYALWWDSLYLEGTVETGNIGLDWSQGDPYAIGDIKNVSQYGCYIDGNTLVIWITNAYPCVDYVFPIDLHGTGTIPVHVNMYYTGGNIDPSWVIVPDFSGAQIHQGDMLWGDVVVHLDNTAQQGAMYTFCVQLDYWQYNEAGPQ